MPTLLTQPDDSFGKGHTDATYQRSEKAMRDLIFMLAPVALIIYFVVFPDQFGALLDWAGHYVR
jgi:hypothetical protein